MKAADSLTHISNPEDKKYLKTPLFDVNMRLFNSSREYKQIVLDVCRHISKFCLTKFDDYKLPHGMSGANVGIPWNIIAKTQHRGTDKAYAYIMINPKIIGRSRKMVETLSNCGSIRLENPIKLFRHEWIVCEWYDVQGNFQKDKFYAVDGGFTIQHEIDHNLGILITDRT